MVTCFRLSQRQFPNVDETGHLPAGLSHLKYSKFDAYRVNPPLARVLTTWAAWPSTSNYQWKWYTSEVGARPEFLWASINLHERRLNLIDDFLYPRAVALIFTMLGFVVIAVWSASLQSLAASMVVAAYWSFSPNILAHAPTIVPDVASVAFGLLACFACWRYMQRATLGAASWAGLAFGLALLTKLTWLTGIVTLPLTAAVCWAMVGKYLPSRSLRQRLSDLLLFWGVAFLTLNAGYLFEDSFVPLGDYEFCSEALGGEGCSVNEPGNRFKNAWLAHVPVPVPRNYLLGIDYLRFEVEAKKWSFLAGEWKLGAWPHYYLITTLLKTPVATLLAAVIGLIVLTIGIYRKMVSPEVISLYLFIGLPAAICFTSVSLQGGFNHHHRYVLTIYPLIFALAAFLASPVAVKLLRFRFPFLRPKKRSIAVPLAVTLVVLSAASSLRVHPYYTSYFNTLSGGPESGWKLLGFSNIDWGQDILEVGKWLKRNPDKRPLVMELDYFHMNADLFGLPRLSPRELPKGASIDEVRKSITETQWWIISVKKLYNYHGHEGLEYLQQIEPVDKIAYAYHVYRIDPLADDFQDKQLEASPPVFSNE